MKKKKFAKFANFCFFLLFLRLENNDVMEITFEKAYLRELYYDGVASDKHLRYQTNIVKKYVRVVNILDSVDKATDLFRYRALHYEKLVGDKAGLESVRVNDQYRIEFKTTSAGGITICNITELSNHYK